VLDLLWKIGLVKGKWTGTLRNDPSVVVSADSGDKLDRLLRGLTIALLSSPSDEHQPSRVVRPRGDVVDAVSSAKYRAERLRKLQARNAERAAAAGQDYESLLAQIRQA
jgi:hypothetical protein